MNNPENTQSDPSPLALEEKIQSLEQELHAALVRAEASEARYRHLVDSMPQIVRDWQPDEYLGTKGSGNLELADIIDADAIQSLLEDFYTLTHIPVGILDVKGKVLVGVGWQEICAKFHRAHPEAGRHCLESDTALTAGVPLGKFRLYKCKNNMWDITSPIIVGGQHVGNIFSGQFFFADESPDIEVFRAQARQYGFDEEAYIAALEAVPRMSRETVHSGMLFFTKFAHMISRSSYSSMTLARSLSQCDSLMASKKAAEEASRAKSEFLANMSHEIRTPMTIFMVATEHLLELEENPERRELLEMAGQSAQRLHTLIDDILDFSRIEAHRVELLHEPFELRGCIEDTITLLSIPARQKNLRIEMEVAAGLPRFVSGDKDRLGQILLNLLGNAIKFTENGVVKVSVDAHDGIFHFAVADTGIGIPQDKMSLLFQSFSQVDGSLTRRHGGTGLGLAICKGLVELMGGEIRVRSCEGEGSTFSFTLPIIPVAQDFTPGDKEPR